MESARSILSAVSVVFCLTACKGEDSAAPPDAGVPLHPSLTADSRAYLDGLRGDFTVKVLIIEDGRPVPGRFTRTPALQRDRGARLEVEGDRIVPRWPVDRDARVDLALPEKASGPFSARDRRTGLGVRARLLGAADAGGEVVDGFVLFREAYAGTATVIHYPTENGLEDWIHFPTRPERERVEYAVELGEAVAGLRLVGNTVEFLDAGGGPRLRVAPPRIHSGDGEVYLATLSLPDCDADRNGSPPWGRPVVAPGRRICMVRVEWAGVSYPALLDPSWQMTNNLTVARSLHTSVKFIRQVEGIPPSPLVMIAGGAGALYPWALRSTEIFNPATNTFAAGPDLATARYLHGGAVVGMFGVENVLVAGGQKNEIGVEGTIITRSAELYDQQQGIWRAMAPMTKERVSHSLTRLTTSAGLTKVLAAGGKDETGMDLSSAEVFTPGGMQGDQGSWAAPTQMNQPRMRHTATFITENKVLVAGGVSSPETAEIYDGDGAVWNATGPMVTPHAGGAAAALLAGGRVLVAGGQGGWPDRAEIYGHTTTACNAWMATGAMTTPRSDFAMSEVPGGALATGGYSGAPPTYLTSAELFDAKAGTWHTTLPLTPARIHHSSTFVAADKGVLAAGGWNNAGLGNLQDAQIFVLDANGAICGMGTSNPDCRSGVCWQGLCCDKECGCGQCALDPGTCTKTLCFGRQPPNGTCTTGYLCDGTSGGCPTTCGPTNPCASGYGCGVSFCGQPQQCLPCPIQQRAIAVTFQSAQTTISPMALTRTADFTGYDPYRNLAWGNFNNDIYPDFAAMAFQPGYDTGDHTDLALYLGGPTAISAFGGCGGQQPAWAVELMPPDPLNFERSKRFRAALVVHLDGDCLSDIVLAQRNESLMGQPDRLYVIRKKDAGKCLAGSSMQKLVSQGDTYVDVAVGDFNADSLLDLVTANNASNSVTPFRNQGGPNFLFVAEPKIANIDVPNSRPVRVLTADFNQDGKTDILVAANSQNSVTNAINIVKATGNFGFDPLIFHAVTTTGNLGPLVTGVTVGDFDGDGRADIAYTDRSDNRVRVLMNSTLPGGSFLFAPEVVLAPPAMPAACIEADPGKLLDVQAADVDNDDKLDLVVMAGCKLAQVGTGKLVFYVNDGAGAFTLSPWERDAGLDGPQTMVAFQNRRQECKTQSSVLVNHLSNPGSLTADSFGNFHNDSPPPP